MKVCLHYKEKLNGDYINLITQKSNDKFVCIHCYNEMSKKDFDAVERYVHLKNQNSLDVDFVEENAIELQKLELPKPGFAD